MYYTRSLDKDFYVELWDSYLDDGHNAWIRFRMSDGSKVSQRYENLHNTLNEKQISITENNLYGCYFKMVQE